MKKTLHYSVNLGVHSKHSIITQLLAALLFSRQGLKALGNQMFKLAGEGVYSIFPQTNKKVLEMEPAHRRPVDKLEVFFSEESKSCRFIAVEHPDISQHLFNAFLICPFWENRKLIFFLFHLQAQRTFEPVTLSRDLYQSSQIETIMFKFALIVSEKLQFQFIPPKPLAKLEHCALRWIINKLIKESNWWKECLFLKINLSRANFFSWVVELHAYNNVYAVTIKIPGQCYSV